MKINWKKIIKIADNLGLYAFIYGLFFVLTTWIGMMLFGKFIDIIDSNFSLNITLSFVFVLISFFFIGYYIEKEEEPFLSLILKTFVSSYYSLLGLFVLYYFLGFINDYKYILHEFKYVIFNSYVLCILIILYLFLSNCFGKK